MLDVAIIRDGSADIAGRPRVFAPYAGGLDAYRRTCDDVAAAGCGGFRLA